MSTGLPDSDEPHEGTASADPTPTVPALDSTMISGFRALAALAGLDDVDPAVAAVLGALNLRIYTANATAGDRSDYVVIDVHGVSIGLIRRASDLYLHVDTTETSDEVIAFEVNGLGETVHDATWYPRPTTGSAPR